MTDFGNSTHTPSLGGPRPATPVHNPTWAAPETRAGVLVARSDVYALGIVLWELATSSHPFARKVEASFMATLEVAIVRGRRPTLPKGMPRGYARAVTAW